MASNTMQDLLDQAANAGISSYEPTDGHYELEVIRANAGKTRAGDPKFGVQFKVLGGPDDGKSFWTNFNLIAIKKSGEPNSAGLAITFRDLDTLGADASTVSGWDVDNSERASEQITDAIVGTKVAADVSVKQNGDYTNIDLRKMRRLSGTSAPAPAAAPAASDEDVPF